MLSHNSRYSKRPCQPSALLMSLTQVWSCMASKTVLVLHIFGGTQLKTFGARSSKEQPCSHLSVHNKVFRPLPTVVTTEIANMATELGWTGTSRPAHSRSYLVFSIHSQHIWSAHPMISRLWILSPLRLFGLMTFSQTTKQLAPLIFFLAFHKNSSWPYRLLVWTT